MQAIAAVLFVEDSEGNVVVLGRRVFTRVRVEGYEFICYFLEVLERHGLATSEKIGCLLSSVRLAAL